MTRPTTAEPDDRDELSGRVRLGGVHVEPGDLSFDATHELTTWLNSLIVLTEREPLLRDVALEAWVSNDFASTVDRLVGHSDRSYTSHDTAWSGARAQAVTLRDSRADGLRAAIVVRPDAWRRGDEAASWRLAIVSREFRHVLQAANEPHADEPWVRTYADWRRLVAKRAWCAFDAQWFAERTVLHGQLLNGRPVETSDRLLREGFADDAAAAMAEFDEVVAQARARVLEPCDLDALGRRANRAVQQFVIMLGHAAGLYAAANDTARMRGHLASVGCFSRVLEPEWDALLAACQSAAPQGIPLLEDVIERLYARRGLRYEDFPDGGCLLHVFAADPTE